MADMTGAVMALCRNYFQSDPVIGVINIDSEGLVHLPGVIGPCQYVAIRGSAMHDGVWQISGGHIFEDGATPELPAETFVGTVWPLHPPKDFLRLCADVAVFESKRPMTPVQSESFGGYSYTIASGQSGPLTWQEAFSSKLTPYRRMFTEVGV